MFCRRVVLFEHARMDLVRRGEGVQSGIAETAWRMLNEFSIEAK